MADVDEYVLYQYWNCIYNGDRPTPHRNQNFDKGLDGDTLVGDANTPFKKQRRLAGPRYTLPRPDRYMRRDTSLDIHGNSSVSSATLCGDDDDAEPRHRAKLSESDIESGGPFNSGDQDVNARPGRASTGARILDDTSNSSVPENYLNHTIVPQGAQENSLSADASLTEGHSLEALIGAKHQDEEPKSWAAAVELPSGYWADAELELLFRLSTRGLESLVPSTWRLDFPMFPRSLFCECGTKDSFIGSMKGREFRAIKALKSVLSIGPRAVRDRQLCHLRPELAVKRILDSYIRWALWDADILHRWCLIPLYTVYALREKQSVSSGVKFTIRNLISMTNRYRTTQRLKQNAQARANIINSHNQGYEKYGFPVLTGFLICGSIVAIITLDSDPTARPALDPETSARFIAKLDFSEPGQDVWNSLAIAISVVWMRNRMLQLGSKILNPERLCLDPNCGCSGKIS
ncbi:uncharacterized protein CIMG_09204 [Coccidioides immitis RS]|uniref:Uncharacterized protein n=3 Tax=Coccidioides immitis TaxID=5501 RepID=J3K1U8_COCIM|nr:uncharacterized protein CIMG_09204 [Coccidioides immitis RS]EAS28000.3 hypothetical protein CIMG_09204 [Coccidioides immitis RS]KMP08809.1 hypothetical protein CIRG_08490 [Coccidioides immitis RMSCC 2394]KMU87942.1 hypothetical protein CIHG_05709 [Coccidioides immitis H538.4]